MFAARDAEAGVRKQQAPRFRELPGCRDLLPLASADPRRYPCLLESAACGAKARWDILFAFPQQTLSLHADGRVRDASGTDCGTGFLQALDRTFARNRKQFDSPRDLPFTGGWLLYLGYELAGEIEPTLRLPREPHSSTPIALALHCPAAILVDRQRERTWLVAEDGEHLDLLDTMQRDLGSACAHSRMPDSMPQPLDILEDDPASFLAGVERIHHYLRSGDTFQVNLSRQWCARYPSPTNPIAIYDSQI